MRPTGASLRSLSVFTRRRLLLSAVVCGCLALLACAACVYSVGVGEGLDAEWRRSHRGVSASECAECQRTAQQAEWLAPIALVLGALSLAAGVAWRISRPRGTHLKLTLRRFLLANHVYPVFEVVQDGAALFDVSKSDAGALEIAFHQPAVGKVLPLSDVLAMVSEATRRLEEGDVKA